MKANEEKINSVIEHSFKNFHTKGLDYICLKRSEEHTRKAYFFDGDVSKLPDVVNPHDHRYDFDTTIITGRMSNSHYEISDEGRRYNQFEWRTPLNGGNGFTWKKEIQLKETVRENFVQGEHYYMAAEEFHTIRMHSDQVIIILDQYDDVVPFDKPTVTFMQEKALPNLSGLYEKFNEDEVIHRLGVLASFGVII